MLPSAQQLLVRAATSSAAEARAAWQEWKARADRRQDRVSPVLLPGLDRNLAEEAAADLPHCRGAYRKTWYENQRLLNDLAAAGRACRTARVPVILGLEPSLLLASYRDPGGRPLERIGLVVAPGRALTAADALIRAGWKPRQPLLGRSTTAYSSAELFWNRSTGRPLELRWRFCWEPEGRSARRRTCPVHVHDEAMPALGPTEQLLGLLTCDFRPYAGNPAPWVADIVRLCRSGEGEIDWRRIVAAARVSGLALGMRVRLGHLRQTWSVAVPDAVIDAVDRSRAATATSAERSIWTRLRERVFRHIRLTALFDWSRSGAPSRT